MKYDNEKYTLVPVDISGDGIICKLVNKTSHIRKNIKKQKAHKKITIGINDELEHDKLSSFMFQYKVARCGSTLLSNMLEKDDSWKIISEPSIFTKIVRNRDIPRKYYLRKVLEIYSIKESKNQTQCYFDFMSQTIFDRYLMKVTFPDIPEFYLYRRPVEVAKSLDEKPPGWYKLYNKDAEKYLKKICKYVKDIRVHYYRNVLSMHVVDWIYGAMDKVLSKEIYSIMKSEFQFYSKNVIKDFNTDEEMTEKNAPQKYKKYFYDKTFTDFFIQNPPYRHLEEGSNKIEKLDWINDRDKILKMMSDGKKPFVVKNIKINSDLFGSRKNWGKLGGLRADRENYFIWHKKNHKQKKCKLYSRWDMKTFDEWKDTKDMYLVVSSNVSSTEHELFDNFLAKTNDKNGHLRISHNGAVTCEHYDGGDTILFVGGGKKKMHLLEPDVCNKLGTYHVRHKLGRRIIPNIMYLDTYQYKVDKKKIWWGDMEEGEVIYFPGLWAHLTITEMENTWSINFRRSTTKTSNGIRSVKMGSETKIEKKQHPYFKKGYYE